MLKLLLRLLAGLQPEPDADAMTQYRWDRRIGMTLTVVILVVIALAIAISVAFGDLPTVGTGFAKASDLQNLTQPIKQQIQAVRTQLTAASVADTRRWALQLSNAIIDARAKQCKVKTDEGKRLYFNNIQRMLDDYQQLTGVDFALPACSDL